MKLLPSMNFPAVIRRALGRPEPQGDWLKGDIPFRGSNAREGETIDCTYTEVKDRPKESPRNGYVIRTHWSREGWSNYSFRSVSAPYHTMEEALRDAHLYTRRCMPRRKVKVEIEAYHPGGAVLQLYYYDHYSWITITIEMDVVPA